jgi:exodeoxyribonuclease VII small subunit
MKDSLTYEEALAQLQDIVKKLENKEIQIDDLATTVSRANELVEFCQNKLQQTETEIQKIMKKSE